MGAGAVVSRTINRGCSTDETAAAVRPAVEPFDDRRDRTVGLLAGLWADRGQVDVAELRKQLSCSPSALIETSPGTSTPTQSAILKAVRRRGVDEAASQLHTHRQRALSVLTLNPQR